MTISLRFTCLIEGIEVHGQPMVWTRAQWVKARSRVERKVATHCLATGEVFADDDHVVLVYGNGTPFGCNIELPRSTVARIGFDAAVLAAHARLQRAARAVKELAAFGVEPDLMLRVQARPEPRPRSIGLDFDKTVFGGPFVRPDIVEGPPKTAEAIPWLKDQIDAGVIVTLHTCRFTQATRGSRFDIEYDRDAVLPALRGWFLQHLTSDETDRLRWWIHAGKPFCDVYLDDKGREFTGTFPSYTGLAPRSEL